VESLPSNARALRALGQAAEAAKLETFELEKVGSDYVLRGKPSPVDTELPPVQSGWLPWKKSPSPVSPGPAPPHELRYTPDDIRRLDAEGRSRRSGRQAMPDAYAPSQILRAAGAYLDRKRAKLLRLSRREHTLELRYETAAGTAEEDLPVSYLYDLTIRLYKNRDERKV
jgi:hypothetical protein